jgi:hypothetical protein
VSGLRGSQAKHPTPNQHFWDPCELGTIPNRLKRRCEGIPRYLSQVHSRDVSCHPARYKCIWHFPTSTPVYFDQSCLRCLEAAFALPYQLSKSQNIRTSFAPLWQSLSVVSLNRPILRCRAPYFLPLLSIQCVVEAPPLNCFMSSHSAAALHGWYFPLFSLSSKSCGQ